MTHACYIKCHSDALIQQEFLCDGHDITSVLLDDITIKMVTLTMGQRQTVTSWLQCDIMDQGFTSGLLTDITIGMATLTV